MSRSRVIVILAAAIALVVVALFLLRDRSGSASQSYDASDGAEVLDDSNPSDEKSVEIIDDRMESRRVVPIIRAPQQDEDMRSEFVVPDRRDATTDKTRWEDPVNEEVLGDPQWIAKPSPEEVARIESILNEKRDDPEARYQRNLDRRAAIETLRPIVDGCVEKIRENAPGALGRVSIAFDFDTTSGRGRIQNARIERIWKLDEYQGFESCVENGITNLTFEARTNDNVMEVEYPFFYEDAPELR